MQTEIKDTIDISKLDKADVLAALYNARSAMTKGRLRAQLTPFADHLQPAAAPAVAEMRCRRFAVRRGENVTLARFRSTAGRFWSFRDVDFKAEWRDGAIGIEISDEFTRIQW